MPHTVGQASRLSRYGFVEGTKGKFYLFRKVLSGKFYLEFDAKNP